ncbi:MAG TPA: hypothetical protein VMU80_12910 [Bryobacteraceae bacterium]|nr:hypothetical protein [Bryobacteraceae bacterium]
MLTRLWLTEPLIIRVFLLVLLIVVSTAVRRIVRLSGRLYIRRGAQISAVEILSGEVDPKALAQYALARRAPADATKDLGTGEGVTTDPATRAEVVRSLVAAESHFLFYCDLSRVDLQSIKTAAILLFFLSISMAAFGTLPIYSLNCNNSGLPQGLCVLESVDQLLDTFGFGMSLCTGLYFITALLERRMGNRIAEWNHFFDRASSPSVRVRL